MRKFLTIWRREFTACFLSPVAYVTMILFIAVSGLAFLAVAIQYDGKVVSPVILNAESIMLWLPVLITIVCMRLFSEERRAGTLEALMTTPVTESQIVAGKYAGAMSFLLLVMLPAVFFVFMLALLSAGGIKTVDIGAWYGSCLILALMAFFNVALGMVVSLFTRNLVVSFFAILCTVWCAMLFGSVVTALPEWMPVRSGDIFSMLTHLEDFSYGSIDTRPIVLYVSGTFLLLFIATRLLESRRWR